LYKSEKIEKTLDKEAFEELFKSFFKPLCSFAIKYVRDIDIAKEIVHDIFVKLWEKRDSIDAAKAVKSYLYTSVNNGCLNYIRDNKKFADSSELINYAKNEQNAQISDKLVEIEISKKISETLDNLSEKCKQVFILSRYEGKKYSEIAEELGISVKTVEAHISKALKELRINLAEYISVILFIWLNM
jgi:RNA polymerase sigma-70 factor, ECF subfamily